MRPQQADLERILVGASEEGACLAAARSRHRWLRRARLGTERGRRLLPGDQRAAPAGPAGAAAVLPAGDTGPDACGPVLAGPCRPARAGAALPPAPHPASSAAATAAQATRARRVTMVSSLSCRSADRSAIQAGSCRPDGRGSPAGIPVVHPARYKKLADGLTAWPGIPSLPWGSGPGSGRPGRPRTPPDEGRPPRGVPDPGTA